MHGVCDKIKIIIVGRQGPQGPPGISSGDNGGGSIGSGLTLPELLSIVSLREYPIISSSGLTLSQQLCIQGLRA